MRVNNERLEHLSKNIYDFVCQYRKYYNCYFYDYEIKNLDSVKKLLDDEDNGVDFMSDLSHQFYDFATGLNFENKQEEYFFDALCSIFKEYNSFIQNYDKDNEINVLADALINYSKDVDPYEYNDSYKNDDQAFEDMVKSLSTISGVNTIIENLCDDINNFASESDLSNEEIFNNFKTASELLIELNNYSKRFEKEKLKEMDM